ncbi:putative RNA repair protein [Escherichia phage JLBYU43]|uniref:RNA repair protein n=1 Tax=Escherichia phage JLBYU43 TaxID=2894751 RepID=A0AAE9CFQ9_9CAUD|nr:putative RNA repair protein [Escherichia phage JLBYU43]
MKLKSGRGMLLVEISNTPVIFLDIDGVLNSSISHHHARDNEKLFFGSDWVYKPLLQAFQNFLKPSPIMIVGVSSWFSV